MIFESILVLTFCATITFLNHQLFVRPLKNDLKHKDEEIQKQQLQITSSPRTFEDALIPWQVYNSKLKEEVAKYKQVVNTITKERNDYKKIAMTHSQESFEKTLNEAKASCKTKIIGVTILKEQNYRSTPDINFKRIIRDAKIAIPVLLPGEKVTVEIKCIVAFGWYRSALKSSCNENGVIFVYDTVGNVGKWKQAYAIATSLNSIEEAVNDVRTIIMTLKAGIKKEPKMQGSFLLTDETSTNFCAPNDILQFEVNVTHWKIVAEQDIAVKVVEVLKTETKIVEIEKMIEPVVKIPIKVIDVDYEKLAAAHEVHETSNGHKNIEVRVKLQNDAGLLTDQKN